MKLWLDDCRQPQFYIRDDDWTTWTWAETAEEAIDLLRTGEVEIASLDYDLDESDRYKGKSGHDVVLWLEQNPEYWPPLGVKVHSVNPKGAETMRQVIERHFSHRRPVQAR